MEGLRGKGKSSRLYKKVRAWHKWVSIVLTFFLLMFAVSGVVLNHRSWFSSVDVSRDLLPSEYRYQNWNMASIRGSLQISPEEILVYGNIGVWKTDGDFSLFTDFNKGFPAGIDNRKISRIIPAENGDLLAGTYFGLYLYSPDAANWQKVTLPVEEKRIVDLIRHDTKVYILTRSSLLVIESGVSPSEARIINIPPAEDDDQKAGLFKTLWIIHSGEIYGLGGKIFVDLMALVVIFLTVTGLILLLFPGWIRKRKKKLSSVNSIARTLKFSLKWHNRLGYYLAVFLVITAITGMFLRPPLLIPIANARVGKIPFSILDQPNPWYDKLRAIIYDDHNNRFILSTSEGFYYSGDDFGSALRKFEIQPPVSVMGINVLESLGHGGFLVGSFSGLFNWFPEQKYMEDAFSGNEELVTGRRGKPFSENSVAGLVWDGEGRPYIFDYVTGAKPFRHENPFPSMQADVVAKSPISLWNLALEVHTGRIYFPLIGDFYILIVPLAGLALLFVVISGFWMYWVGFRKKTGRKNLVDTTGEISS